jgi:hypothetical protein
VSEERYRKKEKYSIFQKSLKLNQKELKLGVKKDPKNESRRQKSNKIP